MGRVAARHYDRILRRAERAGLTAWRSTLLRGLDGDVLEIGAGTGLNLEHYPSSLVSLTLAEPDGAMREVLQRRVARREDAVVIDAHAERLPFASSSFDAVVCTLVLCSVADQSVALGEIRRVLRPGGSLVFIEHVAAPPGSRARTVQRTVDPLWHRLAGNCHLARETGQAIEQAGLRPMEWLEESLPVTFPRLLPTIRGFAMRED